MPEVVVNGRPETFAEGFTVADLLAWLGRAPQGLAVEINQAVVPRSLHASTPLHQGDRIEIVHMVAGG